MNTFYFGNADADIVLVQPVFGGGLEDIGNEAAVIAESSKRAFRLAAVVVDNWNDDLSPWEAPAVFGKEKFGGGAPAALGGLLELCADKSKTYCVGGYSLAGLFSLWAACQTDIFRGVAAASPSVWFPGFSDYMREHDIRADTVYLSLGDKEERTRNPVMASVGERIREAYSLLREQGVDCTLEWNEGNHFRDAGIRTAKAFAWVINRC